MDEAFFQEKRKSDGRGVGTTDQSEAPVQERPLASKRIEGEERFEGGGRKNIRIHR